MGDWTCPVVFVLSSTLPDIAPCALCLRHIACTQKKRGASWSLPDASQMALRWYSLTRRHVFLFNKNTCFLFNKKTCLLVQQEDMFSCSTSRHVLFFNKKTCFLFKQEDIFFYSKKTCCLLQQEDIFFSSKTRVLLQQEYMFSS